MFTADDSRDVKVVYNGKNGGFSNKIIKAKTIQNNNGDCDVLSDFGSEKSRSSSFYFGNGTSNQKMKHHYRETSIGKKQANHSKNQISTDFSMGGQQSNEFSPMKIYP